MVARKLAGRRMVLAVIAACVAALALIFVSLQSGKPAQAQQAPSNVIEFDTSVNWDGVEPAGEVRKPSIVGGTAVPNGRYRFMAFTRILFEDQSGRRLLSSCTGSLLDRNSVLTAAHCVQPRFVSGAWFYAVAIDARVGSATKSSGGQVRGVSRAVSHPRYRHSSINFAFDAAVLQLSAPVTGVTPVRLSNYQQNSLEKPGRNVITAGWGAVGEGGSSPERMRYVILPIRSDHSARLAYARTGQANLKYFPTLMVAAGAAGKDACQGDSGGPLFAPTSRGVSTQIGITSYGRGCARPGFPGVWTEVNSPAIRPFLTNTALSNGR